MMVNTKINIILYRILIILGLFFIIQSIIIFFYFSNPQNSLYPINPHFNYIDTEFFDIFHPQIYYSLFAFQTSLYYFFIGLYIISLLKQIKIFDSYLRAFFLGPSIYFIFKLIFRLLFDKPIYNSLIDLEMLFELFIVVIFLISLSIFKRNVLIKDCPASKKMKRLVPMISFIIFICILYLDLKRYNNENFTKLISEKINLIVNQKSGLVNPGMNESKIISIMGKPFKKFENQNGISWMYIIDSHFTGEIAIHRKMEIVFKDGICKEIIIKESDGLLYPAIINK